MKSSGVLCERITQLKSELEKPLLEIEAIGEQITDVYRKERTFREKSKIVEGQRVFCEADSVELKNYEAKINKYLRKQRTIEKDHKDAFKRLKKYLKEGNRIRDMDKVYRIDTELDQIMTCFKMSFVNLCSLFLARCMGHEKFEMQTLFESIFQLNGESFIANEAKNIELEMNPKEPELMDKLDKGLRISNTMNIRDPDGHPIKFGM